MQGLLEILDDLIALGGRGIDRHEVVVVEVHAPRADFGQQMNNLDGGQRFADGLAKGIGARTADGPQAKGKFVLGFGLEVCHGNLLGASLFIR